MDARTEFLVVMHDVYPPAVAVWLASTCANAADAVMAAKRAGITMAPQPTPVASTLH